MAISAKDVMALREITGTGMMDCKKALIEADGDMDKAVEILREKGLSAAAKKAGRIAAEGIVDSYVSEDGKLGVIVEVNCETDFVAKTDAFHELTKKIAKQIADVNPADVDALMASEIDGATVDAVLNEAVAKIGEKISIRRFERIEGFVDTYIHMGGKIGVLVQADPEPDTQYDENPYNKADEAEVPGIWFLQGQQGGRVEVQTAQRFNRPTQEQAERVDV